MNFHQTSKESIARKKFKIQYPEEIPLFLAQVSSSLSFLSQLMSTTEIPKSTTNELDKIITAAEQVLQINYIIPKYPFTLISSSHFPVVVKKNQQLLLLNDAILRQFLNGCLIDYHPIKTFTCKLHRMPGEDISFQEYSLPQVMFLFLCFAVPAVLIKLS